jgi:16S rRNA (cytidine1402-2'-O)-methyltransferase
MPGTLHVIATPIGNLEDLSARALRVLGEVTLIAAEDTRVTRKLLSHYAIRTPVTPYHAHSGRRQVAGILDRLRAGQDVALVSDAGTPGISDPGGELVRAAVEAGIPVSPVPGPSAVAAALSACGLDPTHFVFQGFLPRTRGDQRRALTPLRPLPHTLVFYEAPGRIADTLRALREELGDRNAVVARELTKRFEEFVRGTLTELAERFREAQPRGECVILVSGAGEPEPATPQDVDAALRELLGSGLSVRDASKEAARLLGIPRKDAYARALDLAKEP